MRDAFTVLLAAIFTANGLFMFFAPEIWYGTIPGVRATGPFNPHFVRDIGCAYLISGGGLLWMLRDPRARPAAMAGAVFQGLHALTHVAEAFEGHTVGVQVFIDTALVIIPGALAIWLSLPRRQAAGSVS